MLFVPENYTREFKHVFSEYQNKFNSKRIYYVYTWDAIYLIQKLKMVITVLYICPIKYKNNDMHRDLATRMFITAVFLYDSEKLKTI